MKPSAEDMRLINKYSKTPLLPDEVYVFKMKLADNEIDRDFQMFSISAMEDLCRLYLGKTGFISERIPAQIFKTELKYKTAVTQIGDPYAELIAYAYIINHSECVPIICQMEDANIKQDISTACSVKYCRCSVCGENMFSCHHKPGHIYGGKLCVGEIIDVTEVYEWNFVKESVTTSGNLKKLQDEIESAKRDIAAMIWLNGDCEYCRFGKKDEYCGASRWTCKLGGSADCRPEWRGQEKTD